VNSALPSLFETIVPQANQSAAAAEFSGYSTIKQKWGYGGLADHFKALAREILAKLEG
jgi:chromosome partitioning protein